MTTTVTVINGLHVVSAFRSQTSLLDICHQLSDNVYTSGNILKRYNICRIIPDKNSSQCSYSYQWNTWVNINRNSVRYRKSILNYSNHESLISTAAALSGGEWAISRTGSRKVAKATTATNAVSGWRRKLCSCRWDCFVSRQAAPISCCRRLVEWKADRIVWQTGRRQCDKDITAAHTST